MLVVGAVAFRWIVAPRAVPGHALDAPLGTLVAGGSVLLLLVAVPRVWLQAASFAPDPGDTWTMVPRVLATTWGAGLAGQCGAAVLTLAAVRSWRGENSAWLIAALAALVLPATPGMMGHANAVEGHRALSLAMDYVHVIAAGAWIGGLVPLLFVARSEERDASAALVHAFHGLAAVCVIAVVGSGIGALLVRFGGLLPLLHSAYGTVLGVKLAFVAIVLALGALHLRGGERAAAAGTLGRSLAFEALVALAVIAATSVLVATDPPTVG